jgi:predicted glutamine amidotransferase
LAVCHNGQVPHFFAIGRRLEVALPDKLYAVQCRSTDSEMMFFTLLANGLDADPAQEMECNLDQIGQSKRAVKVSFFFWMGRLCMDFAMRLQGQVRRFMRQMFSTMVDVR